MIPELKTLDIWNITPTRIEAIIRHVEELDRKLEIATRTLRNFNEKFSPGDDWFPEMRDALALIDGVGEEK